MTTTSPIELSFESPRRPATISRPSSTNDCFASIPRRSRFRKEGGELVRGSMLALAIEAILDFAGARSGHFRLIACEMTSHEAYGTSRELFIDFFRVIRDALRDVLGSDWTRDIDTAWQTLLADIADFAAIQA